jgi:hypothetical protein
MAALPSNVGVGASFSRNPSAPTAARSSRMTESQKRWASRSPRSTGTQAIRSPIPASPIHDRSKTVLPLPGGAETSVTPPATPADSRANSARRATTGGAHTPRIPPARGAEPVSTRPPRCWTPLQAIVQRECSQSKHPVRVEAEDRDFGRWGPTSRQVDQPPRSLRRTATRIASRFCCSAVPGVRQKGAQGAEPQRSTQGSPLSGLRAARGGAALGPPPAWLR